MRSRIVAGRRARPPAAAGGTVADELCDRGYTILRDVLSAQEVDELRGETTAICRGERGVVEGADPGTAEESDDEVLRRFLCVDFPHKISPAMASLLRQPIIVSAVVGAIGANVKAMQTMLFVKSPGQPGQAWHQDEIFIPTRDGSLTAAWIALDDATVDNGCLWVLPGSHRAGVLYPDREQSDPRFDCTDEAFNFPYSDDDAVPVEVAAGDAVLFDGYLLHRSLPNQAARLRRAFVAHYMSAESLLPWGALPPGVHIGEHDYRDIVLVAGSDPYQFKGVADASRVEVRAAGRGGCVR